MSLLDVCFERLEYNHILFYLLLNDVDHFVKGLNLRISETLKDAHVTVDGKNFTLSESVLTKFASEKSASL